MASRQDSTSVLPTGPVKRLLALLPGWEPVRVTLQTAIAVVAAYLLAAGMGLPQPSWAVFSSIFVLQRTIGGTISAAAQRVIGGVIGLGVGLLCLFLIGEQGWRTVLALAVGVGTMGIITGSRPELGYGLVTVAMLVLAPAREMIEAAILDAAAIALGSVCGAATGLAVFPVKAHGRAKRHLGRAVALCGDLLQASMESVYRGEQRDLGFIHGRIEGELHDAREMIAQSRHNEGHGQRTISNMQLLRRVDRLWYTLAIADRLSDDVMADPSRPVLGEPLEAAVNSCCRYLHRLGEALENSKAPPSGDEARESIEALLAAFRELRKEKLTLELDLVKVERLFTLSFTWEQIGRHLDELAAPGDDPAEV